MARGRMLSTSISLSEQMADLASDTHRLLATWMLAHLDREGRQTGSARQLKALVTPLLDVTAEAWAVALEDMERVGLVKRYQDSDGRPVVRWPRFAEHQTGLRPEREAPSRFGPDPDQGEEKIKSSEVKRGRARALVTEDSGLDPDYSGVDPELAETLTKIWPALSADIAGQLSMWQDAYPGLDFVQLAREAKAKAAAQKRPVDNPAAYLGRWYQRAWQEKQASGAAEFAAEHAKRKRDEAAEARLAKQLDGPADAKPIGGEIKRLLAAVGGKRDD